MAIACDSGGYAAAARLQPVTTRLNGQATPGVAGGWVFLTCGRRSSYCDGRGAGAISPR